MYKPACPNVRNYILEKEKGVASRVNSVLEECKATKWANTVFCLCINTILLEVI